MDYNYYAAPQQPYPHLVGLGPHPFPHLGLERDATHSTEPLDAILLPSAYDATAFTSGLPTPQHESPENPTANTPMAVGSVDSGIGAEFDDGRVNRTRSSSEEKDNLTPAQSRRKAQNRAAQRAFRERKERHVKELETKLSALESSTHSLQSDNECLKAALQRARTENEILRATRGHSPSSLPLPITASYPSPGAHLLLQDHEKDEEYSVQPMPNGSVINAAGKDHSRQGPRGKEVPAAKAWDLIQSHTLIKQGLVDVADVCERLRGSAKCDGHGPVFEESAIWQAIDESRRCGGDELI